MSVFDFLRFATRAGVALHDPAAVDWAVWFHDIIHDPHRYGRGGGDTNVTLMPPTPHTRHTFHTHVILLLTERCGSTTSYTTHTGTGGCTSLFCDMRRGGGMSQLCHTHYIAAAVVRT